MLVVELGVQVEVGGRRALVDAVVLAQAGALGLGDRRLARLDRVQRDQRAQQRPLAVARPGVGRRPRVSGVGAARVAADRAGEAVPQRDVRGLLVGVRLELGAQLRVGRARGAGRGLGQRDDGVAVLAGVGRQLVAGQLPADQRW